MRERHCRAWIDDEGLVRRILLDDGASIEFYDFGTDVSIEPPPADQVADLKDLTQPRECKLDDGVPISVGQALVAIGRQGFSFIAGECTLGRHREPNCAQQVARA